MIVRSDDGIFYNLQHFASLSIEILQDTLSYTYLLRAVYPAPYDSHWENLAYFSNLEDAQKLLSELGQAWLDAEPGFSIPLRDELLGL
ncbi:MAG: hypothetical protein J7540_07850 [Roseofilum sp. SID2]|uniref:hypothetical protein n=1 Tax=unclassified Roseofilum TaxID=2620099 RepID=UPI001B2F5841|nr:MULTISPECIES: hypothetical protein [unclassified Roseofilum]MBP0011779.1 hypothetical protein [Roseofilum sp. SID3]MBP0023893.1 hypothetical protein [Roseofilum sp. SID2]